MKNIFYFSLVASILLCFTACSDRLDINEDPLAATSADPNVVLPFVFVQYSSRHVTELGSRTLDVPQQITACFNSPRAGNTSSFLTGNTWGMMYSQVLGNLLLVEQDAAEAGPASNNVAAIAKIFKAHTYFELTSLWEEVPFSQALAASDFPEPIFDSQEDVFRGVLGLLDEAIGLIDQIDPEGALVDLSSGDIIYEGDMELWRRYANSLKLRTLMMMSNKLDVSSEVNEVLGQPLIESNSQAAFIDYAGGAGALNGLQGLVEAFFGTDNESTQVYGVTSTVFDLVEGDPRFDMWIEDLGEGPANYGSFPSPAQAVYSNELITGNLPHMLFLPAEVDLYRAELAMASGDASGADAFYKSGVAKNIAWWNTDGPSAIGNPSGMDISAYVDGLAPASMESIHEQLYLEALLRPVIAWNHVRRTNVPALSAAPGASIGTILKRFNYPPDEVAANPNTPVNLPTDTPMWFEN